jgi:hypothetical protein
MCLFIFFSQLFSVMPKMLTSKISIPAGFLLQPNILFIQFAGFAKFIGQIGCQTVAHEYWGEGRKLALEHLKPKKDEVAAVKIGKLSVSASPPPASLSGAQQMSSSNHQIGSGGSSSQRHQKEGGTRQVFFLLSWKIGRFNRGNMGFARNILIALVLFAPNILIALVFVCPKHLNCTCFCLPQTF